MLKVRRLAGRPGFRVETSQGPIEANNVVVATGAFHHPVIPDLVPQEAAVLQIHSNAYRNPAQLPDGAVLIVGAGSSGGQIADELLRAGRRVYLSVGPHQRPPRAYRQRDYCWWLGVLGKWDLFGTHARGPACHDLGERGEWRPYGGVPPLRRARHDPSGHDQIVQGRQPRFQRGLCREPCAGRCQLHVGAG